MEALKYTLFAGSFFTGAYLTKKYLDKRKNKIKGIFISPNEKYKFCV